MRREKRTLHFGLAALASIVVFAGMAGVLALAGDDKGASAALPPDKESGDSTHQPPGGGAPETLRPAPIESVTVVLDPTTGVHLLVVKAGLPGGCVNPAGYLLHRDGETFYVTVNNAVPATPTVCTTIYGYYETVIPLEDLIPGVEYSVDVNGTIVRFTGDGVSGIHGRRDLGQSLSMVLRDLVELGHDDLHPIEI